MYGWSVTQSLGFSEVAVRIFLDEYEKSLNNCRVFQE